MKTAIITISSIFIFLSGCIPSLHPIYTIKDIVFDTNLVGVWKESKTKGSWVFEKGENNSYQLIHTEKGGDKSILKAHLVKIGAYQFLDLYPTGPSSGGYLYDASLFPVHLFLQINIENKKLSINMFDPSWLEKQIEKGVLKIEHVKSDEGMVLLTAPTEKLQQFLIENAENKSAFMEELILEKKG